MCAYRRISMAGSSTRQSKRLRRSSSGGIPGVYSGFGGGGKQLRGNLVLFVNTFHTQFTGNIDEGNQNGMVDSMWGSRWLLGIVVFAGVMHGVCVTFAYDFCQNF
nr:hypothetical protein Iba_chr12cCG11820 [Ipomoea batatas]